MSYAYTTTTTATLYDVQQNNTKDVVDNAVGPEGSGRVSAEFGTFQATTAIIDDTANRYTSSHDQDQAGQTKADPLQDAQLLFSGRRKWRSLI